MYLHTRRSRHIDARPDIFTGWLLVLNTGPVEREPGTFSTRGKAGIAGLKMGLSVRVRFVNGFLMATSFYEGRSGFISAWSAAMTEAGVTYTTTQPIH